MPTSKAKARSAAEPKSREAKAPERSGAAAARSAAASVLPETTASVVRVARELRRWSDHVLGIAGSATELSLNLAKVGATRPAQQAAIEKAGALLRQAREMAGMTTKEVGKAIDMKDISLIEQAEVGRVVLPFEVILRLAAVLGRHDPLTFAMKLARSYNPALWKGLEDLGIGRLVVQAGRERELANIYRSNDAARRLSDADFSALLLFVKAGFDAAVQFRTESAAERAARGSGDSSAKGRHSAA